MFQLCKQEQKKVTRVDSQTDNRKKRLGIMKLYIHRTEQSTVNGQNRTVNGQNSQRSEQNSQRSTVRASRGRSGGHIKAEDALGATCVREAVAHGGEAKEASSRALNMVNNAVFRQSVSGSFVSLSLSLTLIANFGPSRSNKDRVIYFYIKM